MTELIINKEHVVIVFIVIGYISGFFFARNITLKEIKKAKQKIPETEDVFAFLVLFIVGPVLTVWMVIYLSVMRILK